MNLLTFKKTARRFLSKKTVTTVLFISLLKIYAQPPSNTTGSMQKISLKDVIDLMYSGHHLSFGLYLTLCERAMISKTTGNYNMSSSPQLGYEFRFTYYYNINPQWSLVSGLYAGVCGRNYLLTIPKQDIDSSLNEDYVDNGAATREKDIFYISIPIGVQKRWWNNKLNGCWFADLGAGVNWSLSIEQDMLTEELYIPGQGLVQILSMNTTLNNNGKPWLTLNSGAGHQWVLSNKNILSANLNLFLSFSKVARGSYQITVPGQPVSEGEYSVSTTHIGLGVNYIFTGTKKKFKKLVK